MPLFAPEQLYEEDNSPLENLDIKQLILYYSEEDTAHLKKRAKEVMRVYFPDVEEGNLSLLILELINEKYADIQIKKTPDAGSSGIVAGNLFDQQGL